MKNLLKITLLTTAILGISPIGALADNDGIEQGTDAEFVSVVGSYVLPDPVGEINGRAISKQEFNGFLVLTQGISVDEVNDPFIARQILRMIGVQEALATEARKRGLDQDINYQQKVQFTAQKLLTELLQRAMIANNELDVEAIKAEYEKSLQGLMQHEYLVSQILLDTPEEAQAIIDAINRKERTFAQAARAANDLPEDDAYDGSLGDWFDLSMIDTDFGNAMVALQKGEMSASPVKTEYGYHVILLRDVREIEYPAFETIDAEMVYQLSQPVFEKFAETVQESVKVELPKTK